MEEKVVIVYCCLSMRVVLLKTATSCEKTVVGTSQLIPYFGGKTHSQNHFRELHCSLYSYKGVKNPTFKKRIFLAVFRYDSGISHSVLCRINTSQSVQEQVKPTNKEILKKGFDRILPFFPPLIFYCLAPVGQFPCWLSRGIKIKEIKSQNKRYLGVIFCWRFSMQLCVPKVVVDKVRFRLQIFTVQN